MKRIYSIFILTLIFQTSLAQTWTKKTGPYGGYVGDIVVHPTNFTVYAIGGSGPGNGPMGALYRSTDNGATWVEQNDANASGLVAGDVGYFTDVKVLSNGTLYLLSSPNGNGGGNTAAHDLYKSTDDGAHWTKLNSGNGSANGGFDYGIEMSVNPATNTIYVVGFVRNTSTATWYRSTNGGSTFTKGFSDNIGLDFRHIAITSTGDVYAIRTDVTSFSSQPQLWKSTSASDGVTFTNLTSSNIPETSTSTPSYLTSKADNSELLIVMSGSNMFTLSSPFTTWTSLIETNISPTNYGGQAVVGYSPDGASMFLQDNQNHNFYSRLTSLASNSWTSNSTSFLSANHETGICLTAKDATTLYAGTNSTGFWKSINGGTSWTESDNGIEAGNYTGIVAADNGNLIVAGPGAYVSTDQGGTWSRVSNISISGPYYYPFKASTGSPKPIVVVGSFGQSSYKSTDNGATWSATTAGPNAYNYVSSDGTKILGASNTQFFYTSDQGTTWSAAITISGTGWPSGSFNVQSSAIDNTGLAFIYLRDNTSSTDKFFKLQLNSATSPTSGSATQINLASVGSGLTQINGIGYLNGKYFIGGRLISGNSDVLISTTDGSTWNTLGNVNTNRIFADPTNDYLFVSQNNNGITEVNLSRDEGLTFSQSPINSSSRSNLFGIVLNSSGVAFAGLSNSSIYTSTNTIVTPQAPTSLINSTGIDRATLRWIDNSNNETRFIVTQLTGASYDSIGYVDSNAIPGTGTKLYFEVKNLQPNTSYTFRVYAKNLGGYSSPATITFSTLPSVASSIPDNRSWSGTVTGTSTTTLTNVLIRSLGNGYYSISDIANGAMIGQNTTIAANFFESNNSTYLIPLYPKLAQQPSQPNTNGTWDGVSNPKTLVLKWITTTSVSPESVGTVTLTLNSTDPTPAAPSTVLAYAYSNTSIEISWSGSAYETQYVVERANDIGFTTGLTTVGTVNYPTTSIIDSDAALVIGNTYYYRVKAKNSTGTSAAANAPAFTFAKPKFTLSGTAIESTPGYSSASLIWGDFDGDGDDDLIVSQLTFFNNTNAVPKAFQNDGAGNFVAVTPTGIVPSLYTVGSAVDYDNDGKLDLFFSSAGAQNYLYKGNGDFTFAQVFSTPVTENIPFSAKEFDLSPAWADHNNDGLLDLLTINNYDSINSPSKFFVQGPVGTFTKATTGTLATIFVKGSSAVWADYDNDGDQDVFVNNQNSSGSAVNNLYKNNGDGTFTRVTGAPFDTDINKKSFTGAWGDYNNDGYLDLFISGETNNLLYKNNGNGTFTKQTMASSITETQPATTTSFCAAWGDINNDGYLDLMVANAGVESDIYISNSGTSFTKYAGEKFNDIRKAKLSIAFSDYNGDGLLDLAASAVNPAIFGQNQPLTVLPNITYSLFKNNTASTNNWFEARLTGTTSNKLAIGARVTLVSGGKTQIREVASLGAFGSQNSQVVHFGIGTNTSITSVQVKWPSGLVQTFLSPSKNTIYQITEDNTPPIVVTPNPLYNATKVPLATKIELTFDETIVPVASKKIYVYVHGSGSPAYTFDAVIDGVLSSANGKTNNKISFTPSSPLTQLTNYDVTVDAGAFTDVYGNATAAIALNSWKFVSRDTDAPVIAYTPPATLDKGFQSTSTPFSIGVTDNSGTVQSATLYYRKIAGSTFTALPGSNGGSGTWNFTVQESFCDGNGLEFYIKAKDPDGNIGRLPLLNATDTTFYVYMNYPTGNNILPPGEIGFGGAVSNWKIFAVPFDYSSTGVVDVLSDLKSLNYKTDWRLLTYDQTNKSWLEYPSVATFQRGVGYFINVRTQISGGIIMPAAKAEANNRKTLFTMPIKAGWNQVGNPYLTQINWADVVTISGLTGKAVNLKTFSSGSYIGKTSLAPFEGGFFFSDVTGTLTIPFAGQTAIGGRKASATFAAGDWVVPLTLSNGEIENKFGGVGMHSSASLSYDQLDDINAPRFIEYLEMNFPHPEDISKHFARDVVPQASEYTWEFTVDSNINGLTELKWENISNVPKDIYLYDIKRETIVNMKEKSSYTLDRSSSLLRIYYGDNVESKIKPLTISLGDAYPNPSASGKITVPFTLPDSPTQYQVSLEVYDMLGQRVATLVNGSLAAGFYSSQWEPGQELNNGMYLYRIKVAGNGKLSALSKKIIVNH